MPSKPRKAAEDAAEEEDLTQDDPALWRVVWRSYDVTLDRSQTVYTFGDEIPIPLAEARKRSDCSVEPRVDETQKEA